MQQLIQTCIDAISKFGINLLYALVVLVVGIQLIHFFLRKFVNFKGIKRIDPNLSSFLRSFLKILLYVMLIVICCGIIGIPATSFITILASCGVAVGLALQGSLSNFAGGLMILFFKPFRVGDYVSCNGIEGTVKEIQTFYTILITVDNKIITIPNSSLTSAPVTDFSKEEKRRVDLAFYTADSYSCESLKALINNAIDQVNGYYKEDERFVRMSCQTKGELKFDVRVWCAKDKYWDVYYDLNEKIHEAFEKEHILSPSSYITMRNEK